MGYFRKKPVLIEAKQFDGTLAGAAKLTTWMDAFGASWRIDPVEVELYVVTLEGEMRVSSGDWLIQGVAEEFYPCRADIFWATYDESA
jgi:hypothetical protein